LLNCFSAFLYTVGTELNDSPLFLQKTSCKGDVKKAQTAKNAEKYKKSNGLKDKQNDSKQQFLCFFHKIGF